jgi:hypothetical protein
MRELLRDRLHKNSIFCTKSSPLVELYVQSPLRNMREVEAAAGTLGLTVVTVEIRRIEDIAPGFQAREDRADMFRPTRS